MQKDAIQNPKEISAVASYTILVAHWSQNRDCNICLPKIENKNPTSGNCINKHKHCVKISLHLLFAARDFPFSARNPLTDS